MSAALSRSCDLFICSILSSPYPSSVCHHNLQVEHLQIISCVDLEAKYIIYFLCSQTD